MSATLLQAMSTYLASEINGYTVKYYKWTDQDLAGSGEFVVFRMVQSGNSNNLISRPVMLIQVVANPATVTAADAVIHNVHDALLANDAPTGMVKVNPVGRPMGPYYLENGRAVFELNVRCYVDGPDA